MTMLEKIVREMELAALVHGAPRSPRSAHDLTKAIAIAAVKAMREPTEEIIALGGNGPWQAFIDSILATQPQEQEPARLQPIQEA